MQFEATLEMFGAEYEVQYLLMPVQIRNKKWVCSHKIQEGSVPPFLLV
jgi:hypothetical protein